MAHNVDISSLSPDDNLEIFSRTSLFKMFLLSALIHIVLLGGSFATSLLEAEPEKASVTGEEGQDGTTGNDQPGSSAEGSNGEKPAAGEVKPAPDGTQPTKDDPRIKNKAYQDKLNEVKDPITSPTDIFGL